MALENDLPSTEQLKFLKNELLPHYAELMQAIVNNDPEQVSKENLSRFLDDVNRAYFLQCIDDPSLKITIEETEQRIKELIQNLNF